MRYTITRLIFAYLFCGGISIGGETTVVSPGWIQSARDLRFEMKSDKSVYRTGELVNLTFTITNMAGEAKVMQSGSPRAQFAIWVYRDGELVALDSSKADGGLVLSWFFRPTDPVPAGKSHVERLELSGAYDLSLPGHYRVRAVKWYAISNNKKTPKDEKEGLDYLETTINFTILALESEQIRK